MRISGPFVTAGVLHGFDAFLAARGVQLRDVITTAKLPYSELDTDHHTDLPLVDVMALLEAAASITRAPCLGAEWGEVYSVSNTGTYGYILNNARTLDDALKITIRYLSLVVHPVAVKLDYSDQTAVLTWHLSSALMGRATQYILFATGATVGRLKYIAGAGWHPYAVELPCPELPCAAIIARAFGPSVHFNSPQTRITISRDSLSRENRHADPRLGDLMAEYGDRLLQDKEKETRLTQLTRRAIAGRIGAQEVSLETIAAELKISPRTLQSRLAAENTSFENVLQLTKQRLAENYLRDTDLPLTEIAQRLGFSELSAFSRAVLRWFNKSPRRLRRQLRPVPATETAAKTASLD